MNTIALNDQFEPDIAALANGGFVIVWISNEGILGDAGFGINAQIFDGNGNPVGEQFLVNQLTTNNQGDPAIAPLADGGFAVTWYSFDGQDPSESGIKARLFDADGTARQIHDTDENSSVRIDASVILANDIDPEGRPLEIIGVSQTSDRGATVIVFDVDGDQIFDHMLYDPSASSLLAMLDSGQVAEDSFTYTVTDQDGNTDTATTKITVGGKTDDVAAAADLALLLLNGFVTPVIDGELIGGTDLDDSLMGVAEGDLVKGYGGQDTLAGSDGADMLEGGQGNDQLFGEGGNDILLGGQGDDDLIGGDNNDTLFGGEGNDTLNGGSGADFFVFSQDNGDDTVTDFELGVDAISVVGGLKLTNYTETDTDGNGFF